MGVFYVEKVGFSDFTIKGSFRIENKITIKDGKGENSSRVKKCYYK